MIFNFSLKEDGDTKITQNFQVKEFACKDGSDTIKISNHVIYGLQDIRNYIHKPIKIISGYRTEEYNKSINGAENSYHCKGMACDIQVEDMNIYELGMIASHFRFKGVIIYPKKNFIHVDIRENYYFKVVE